MKTFIFHTDKGKFAVEANHEQQAFDKLPRAVRHLFPVHHIKTTVHHDKKEIRLLGNVTILDEP